MSDKQFDNSNSGALFKNTEKQTDNHPDYKGQINVAGTDYWISSWLKTSSKGVKYMSLSVTLKERKDVSSTVPATQGRGNGSNAPTSQRVGSGKPSPTDDRVNHRASTPESFDDDMADLPF